MQSTEGLGEDEYRSEGTLMNKYALCQSHRWCHHSETAVPITVTHDVRQLKHIKKQLLQENHVAVWTVQRGTM